MPDLRQAPAFAELKCFLKNLASLGKDLDFLKIFAAGSLISTPFVYFSLNSDKRLLRPF